MDELPRQKLAELLTTYGRSLCDDPRRCEGLLRDFCGAHKREVNVLVSALKERVVSDLFSSSATSQPREVLLDRLTKRLTDNLGLAEDAARWAVESWALALGIMTTQDLRKPRKETGNSQKTEATEKGIRTTKKTEEDDSSTRDRKEESPTLTPREREIVSLFAQGYNEPAIAARLGTSEETVRKHLTTAQRKAGVFSRPDLVLWAIKQGLRPSDPPKPKDTTKKIDSQTDLKPPPVEQKKEEINKQSNHTDGQDADGSSTLWSGLLAVLSIPFILAGLMVFLFASAIIAALPILLVLWALGMDWDQLGDTAQGVLGLLLLGLTVGVMGLLAAGWEVLKRKLGYVGSEATPTTPLPVAPSSKTNLPTWLISSLLAGSMAGIGIVAVFLFYAGEESVPPPVYQQDTTHTVESQAPAAFLEEELPALSPTEMTSSPEDDQEPVTTETTREEGDEKPVAIGTELGENLSPEVREFFEQLRQRNPHLEGQFSVRPPEEEVNNSEENIVVTIKPEGVFSAAEGESPPSAAERQPPLEESD